MPLHATDDLRRECYRRQKSAYMDVYSRGAVTTALEVEQMAGGQTQPATSRQRRAENRVRQEAGDFVDEAPPAPATVATPPTRKRR